MMETKTDSKEKKVYECQKAARERAVSVYPDQVTAALLNEYMEDGNSKSELLVELARAFFKARREQGRTPSVINISL